MISIASMLLSLLIVVAALGIGAMIGPHAIAPATWAVGGANLLNPSPKKVVPSSNLGRQGARPWEALNQSDWKSKAGHRQVPEEGLAILATPVDTIFTRSMSSVRRRGHYQSGTDLLRIIPISDSITSFRAKGAWIRGSPGAHPTCDAGAACPTHGATLEGHAWVESNGRVEAMLSGSGGVIVRLSLLPNGEGGSIMHVGPKGTFFQPCLAVPPATKEAGRGEMRLAAENAMKKQLATGGRRSADGFDVEIETKGVPLTKAGAQMAMNMDAHTVKQSRRLLPHPLARLPSFRQSNPSEQPIKS